MLALRLTSGIYTLSIDAIGAFTFAIPLAEGTRYVVDFKDPMKQMVYPQLATCKCFLVLLLTHHSLLYLL